MTIHIFMKSLSDFKTYMTGCNVPNYVLRYCDLLDEQGWQWFYGQVGDALNFVGDIERFFYILKWILKYDFIDLTYEIFVHDIMDPESCSESLIKDECREFLEDKYNDELVELIGGIINPQIDDEVVFPARYDETLFLNTTHKENFQSLLHIDQTHPSDSERRALFFILSGNPVLYGKKNLIYDFKRHCINIDIDNTNLHLSSGIHSLLVLGRNLYNGYCDNDTSPRNLFWHLDSKNILLAINTLKMFFIDIPF